MQRIQQHKTFNWQLFAYVVIAFVLGLALGGGDTTIESENGRFSVQAADVRRMVLNGGHGAGTQESCLFIRTDTRTGQVEAGVFLEEKQEETTKTAIAWTKVKDLQMLEPEALAFLREFQRLAKN